MKLLFLLLAPALANAQLLTEKLTGYLQQLPPTAHVSVAFESLTDATTFYQLADEAVPAASVIKVPILVEAMERVKNGQFDPDKMHVLLESEKTGGSGILATYPDQSQVANRDLLTLMITHSDNTATNILIRELGLAAINQRMRLLGLPQSRLSRIMMDTLAAKQGWENRVTAREMNLLLKKIYEKEVATPDLCDQMIDILKSNEDPKTFRRLLPKTAVIAHKSGTLSYIRGDVGIFYVPKPFLLSVFVQGTTTEEAERIISELAEICYQQFQ